MSRELNDTRDAHLGDASARRREKEVPMPEVEWLSVGGAAGGQCRGLGEEAGMRGSTGHWCACITATQTSNFFRSNFTGQIIKKLAGHSK